jgi:hypothetical protein
VPVAGSTTASACVDAAPIAVLVPADGYSVGVIRWHNRVVGYAFILVTDRYPPFALGQPEAHPGAPPAHE